MTEAFSLQLKTNPKSEYQILVMLCITCGEPFRAGLYRRRNKASETQRMSGNMKSDRVYAYLTGMFRSKTHSSAKTLSDYDDDFHRGH